MEQFERLFSRDYALSKDIPSNSRFRAVRELGAEISASLLPVFLLLNKEESSEEAISRFKKAIDSLAGKQKNAPFRDLYDFGKMLGEPYSLINEHTSLKEFRSLKEHQLNKAFTFGDIIDHVTDIVQNFISNVEKKAELSVDKIARYLKSSINTLEHNLFEAGLLNSLMNGDNPEDVYVIKITYPGCCKYCDLMYNSRKDGSPIVFRLSDLMKNGWDLYRKPSEYKPVVSTLHFNCRCTLMRVEPTWDKTKLFNLRTTAWESYNEAMKAYYDAKTGETT